MSESTPSTPTSNGDWRFAHLAFITVGVGALLWPTMLQLIGRWNRLDEAYSHGYLLLAAATYFTYLQRYRIAAATIAPDRRWLIPLIASVVLWLASQIVGIAIVGSLLLPIIIGCAIGAALGTGVLIPLLFPLALLYIAIPLWEELLETPLRDLTTAVVSRLLTMVDFPAFIDGYRIDIPEGSFFVAGGCSGLSFFLTGLAISTSFGFLNFTTWSRRITFVAICAFASLLSNWIRVFSLVLIGHYTNMQSSLIGHEGHLMFGWYVFAGTLLLLLFVGYRIARRDPIPDFGDATQARPQTMPVFGTLVPLLCVAVGSGAAWYYQRAPIAVASFGSPAGFIAIDAAPAWQPAFKSFDAAYDGLITVGETHAQVALRTYLRQRQGAELLNSTNELIPHADDHVIAQRVEHIAGLDHGVNATLVRDQDTGRPRLIYSWYYIDGKGITGGRGARLAQLRAILHGNTDGTLVALSALCVGDCQDAQRALTEVALRHEATLHALIDKVVRANR